MSDFFRPPNLNSQAPSFEGGGLRDAGQRHWAGMRLTTGANKLAQFATSLGEERQLVFSDLGLFGYGTYVRPWRASRASAGDLAVEVHLFPAANLSSATAPAIRYDHNHNKLIIPVPDLVADRRWLCPMREQLVMGIQAAWQVSQTRPSFGAQELEFMKVLRLLLGPGRISEEQAASFFCLELLRRNSRGIEHSENRLVRAMLPTLGDPNFDGPPFTTGIIPQRIAEHLHAGSPNRSVPPVGLVDPGAATRPLRTTDDWFNFLRTHSPVNIPEWPDLDCFRPALPDKNGGSRVSTAIAQWRHKESEFRVYLGNINFSNVGRGRQEIKVFQEWRKRKGAGTEVLVIDVAHVSKANRSVGMREDTFGQFWVDSLCLNPSNGLYHKLWANCTLTI